HAETLARKIISDPAYDIQEAHFSPDGRWITFAATENAPTGAVANLYVVPATGGTWIRLTASNNNWNDRPTWSPDGKTIYFISNAAGFFNVWGIHFDPRNGRPSGQRFRVTAFDKPSLMIPEYPYTVGLSVTQDKLVLTLEESSSSLWLLDR